MALTKTDIETREIRHKYGGNGYAVFEDFGDEYCRLIAIGPKGHIGNRVFTVWKEICFPHEIEVTDKVTGKVEKIVPQMITPEHIKNIQETRAKIDSGRMAIKNGFLVAV